MVCASAISLPVDESARGAAVCLVDLLNDLHQRRQRQRAALVGKRSGGVAQASGPGDRIVVVRTKDLAIVGRDAEAVERRGEESEVVQVVARHGLSLSVGLDDERTLIESDRIR